MDVITGCLRQLAVVTQKECERLTGHVPHYVWPNARARGAILGMCRVCGSVRVCGGGVAGGGGRGGRASIY